MTGEGDALGDVRGVTRRERRSRFRCDAPARHVSVSVTDRRGVACRCAIRTRRPCRARSASGTAALEAAAVVVWLPWGCRVAAVRLASLVMWRVFHGLCAATMREAAALRSDGRCADRASSGCLRKLRKHGGWSA